MAGDHQFDITSLGYLVIESGELDEWRRFAGPGLGMQVVDKSTDTIAFRMDDCTQTVCDNELTATGALYHRLAGTFGTGAGPNCIQAGTGRDRCGSMDRVRSRLNEW